MLLLTLFAGLVASTTSNQWLLTLNTSIFWPTSTNYFYGPTHGPKASAVSCDAEWVQYAGRSEGLWSLGPTAVTTSTGSYATSQGACRTSVSLEDWSDPHSGPLTTLCDNIPRALGPRETVTAYYPGTGPCVTGYQTYSELSSFYRSPHPSPHCTLHTSECIAIWSTWSSRFDAYLDSITTSIPGDTNSPIAPWDCPSTTRSYPEDNPCSDCHFLPGTATLFYWPVTTAAGDLCLQNGTTVTQSDQLSTVLVNGSPFVSPTVYLSFTSIYAWSNRRAHPGSQCGVDHTNTVLALDPSTLSSVRGHRNAKYPVIGTDYPFNFAEFMPQTLGTYTQSLIPWPQYRGGEQCPLPDQDTCTMVRDDYVPWVLLPEEVRAIDPGWTVCDRDWYIPPVTMVALDRPQITLTATATATETPAVADVSASALLRGGAQLGQVAAPTADPTRGW